MRGNESHAWSTWREHRAKVRHGGPAMIDPATLEQRAARYLDTRSTDALKNLADDASTFADLIGKVLADRLKSEAESLQDHHEALSLVCDLLEDGNHLELALQVTTDWALVFGNIHVEMVRRGVWEKAS